MFTGSPLNFNIGLLFHLEDVVLDRGIFKPLILLDCVCTEMATEVGAYPW